MALRLTIENIATLPDGGPVSFTMDGTRPIDIGRDKHVDWTLPDPTRYISGKHCEVHYREHGYWLQDVSTNGTFLSGADHRVRSPHQLRHGDCLIIGHYMIAVAIDAGQVATPYAPQMINKSTSAVWKTAQAAPPPAVSMDWSDAPSQAPNRPTNKSTNWDDDPSPVTDAPVVAETAPTPARSDDTSPDHANPFLASSSFTEAAADVPATPQPTPSRGGALNHGQAFARRIAQGASLPDNVFDQRDPQQLVEQIGQLIRLSVDNVMTLLQARSEAKRMTRSSSQTTVQAVENNALKFAPSAEEAMKIMFGPKSRTYLDAKPALDQGFKDLQSHQQRTFAAMQHAIAAMSTELDPVNIEKDAREHASNIDTFRSHKGRLWDVHVARWQTGFGREKGAAIERFMQPFGEHYDRS